MRSISRLIPLVLVLHLLGGCASTHPLAPESPDELLRAFVAALNYADIDALTDLFDSTATAFLPLDSTASELVGRDAISRAFTPFFQELRRTGEGPEYMHLVPKRVHIQHLGSSFAIVTFDAGVGPVVSRRTLVVKREPFGWRVLHFHGSNIRTGTGG